MKVWCLKNKLTGKLVYRKDLYGDYLPYSNNIDFYYTRAIARAAAWEHTHFFPVKIELVIKEVS